MADDPSNTKPELSLLDEADWVSATELGEHITQINCGAWVLAPGDIQEALAGGCSAKLELVRDGQKLYVQPLPEFWRPDKRLLLWVNALNPSMQRQDYPDRPWPWELRAYLLASEREDFDATARIFLRRAEAVQWGLLPALESPQAVASEERPPPREQPGEPTVGPAGGEAAPAPAPAADASAPAPNTEVPVAKPEPPSPPLVDAIVAETPAANTALPTNRGGRPTDRDMVLEEAGWRLRYQQVPEAERRLRHQQVPKTLRAFGRELREWLKDHGEHHVVKTGEVMQAKTIEDHVRPLWKAHKAHR